MSFIFKPKVYAIMENGTPVAIYATEGLARSCLQGKQYITELPYVEHRNYTAQKPLFKGIPFPKPQPQLPSLPSFPSFPSFRFPKTTNGTNGKDGTSRLPDIL